MDIFPSIAVKSIIIATFALTKTGTSANLYHRYDYRKTQIS